MKTMLRMLTCLSTAVFLLTAPAGATEQDASATVRLPLSTYASLIDGTRDPRRHAPGEYALGNADVTVEIEEGKRGTTGVVRVGLTLDVLEDEWTGVPVLPAGTPVESAAVNGKPVQLMPTPDGLVWSTKTAGSYTMQLVYRVDAVRSGGGFSLPLPLPRAAATRLSVTLPRTGVAPTVIPSVGMRVETRDGTTFLTATVPTTGGVQLSWRASDADGWVISRAAYDGELREQAVVWTGELEIEVTGDEPVTVPLLPRGVTLSGMVVDGEDAPVLVQDDRFATRIQGAGVHRVRISFHTPVHEQSGLPAVDFRIPEIPISQFTLSLPGKKELTVSPASNVTARVEDKVTLATAHVPMTGHVSFSWTEAVPEEIRTEVRANAAVYHAVHADEGVLYVRAIVQYEVNRGETSQIRLDVPTGVQINRIADDQNAVADWRVEDEQDGRRLVTVFLDRKLEGSLMLDLQYDRSLPADEGLAVPLVFATDAHRQRGMVALLASRELTLDPVGQTAATKVGENQLPTFVREHLEMTVAHTYKYTDLPPQLHVAAAVPERVQGRFDAVVDTLISLGDVTLIASASAEVNVKSGTIMELDLTLPADVNLLNLGAPSLRAYTVEETDEGQLAHVAFTQEMEGQFRLDLTYERILKEDDGPVSVPTLAVAGAEVEQGRLAIEATSAVEVSPVSAEQLSPIDVADLPRRLVLRTTNPILLAYKYAHADHALSLEVTRHEAIGVKQAAIDTASYSTLVTADGLAVTTARFTVRNSRKQFLRVLLPEGSEVWSVMVDGRPEKPAAAGDGEDDRQAVLIKIVNSTEGFPVELIYATETASIGGWGRLRAELPRPDILVTETRWDLYLPDGVDWSEPRTNLEPAGTGNRVSGEEISKQMESLDRVQATMPGVRPLRITVPASGIHFAFDKLYANHADRKVWAAVAYTSRVGTLLGQAVAVGGTLLFWLGLAARLRREPEARPAVGWVLAVVGLAAVGASLSIFGVGIGWPLGISSAVAAVFLVRHVAPVLRGRREATAS